MKMRTKACTTVVVVVVALVVVVVVVVVMLGSDSTHVIPITLVQ